MTKTESLAAETKCPGCGWSFGHHALTCHQRCRDERDRLRAALQRIDELMIRERQSNKGYVSEVRKTVHEALNGERTVRTSEKLCGVAYIPRYGRTCELPAGHSGDHAFNVNSLRDPEFKWSPSRTSGNETESHT